MPNGEIDTLESRLPSSVGIEEAKEVFSIAMNFFRECEITKRETARYDSLVTVMTTEINRRYDLWEKVFTEVFRERRVSILKFFEIIDKGMETNDKQLINMGLMNLSNMVATSPFANIDQIINAINTGQQVSI